MKRFMAMLGLAGLNMMAVTVVRAAEINADMEIGMFPAVYVITSPARHPTPEHRQSANRTDYRQPGYPPDVHRASSFSPARKNSMDYRGEHPERARPQTRRHEPNRHEFGH
jgi:hypothetical protein